MVEDKMFNGLVKKWFMRIFSLKLNEMYKSGLLDGKKYKIFSGQISASDVNDAKSHDDLSWQDFIGVSDGARNLFNTGTTSHVAGQDCPTVAPLVIAKNQI